MFPRMCRTSVIPSKTDFKRHFMKMNYKNSLLKPPVHFTEWVTEVREGAGPRHPWSHITGDLEFLGTGAWL